MKLKGFIVAGVFTVLCGCPGPNNGLRDGSIQRQCVTRDECLDGKVCSELGECVDCVSSGQCRTKEVCGAAKQGADVKDANRCILKPGWGTECATNEMCSAGQWCKQGLCIDRSQVSLCPNGDSKECAFGDRCNGVTRVCEEDLGCTTNTDCSGAERCNTGLRQCVPSCTVDTQGSVCGPGEKCVKEICAQCSSNNDCGAGLTCDAAGQCSTGDKCYSDRDCQVPLLCFKQTGACLPAPAACTSDSSCALTDRCDLTRGKCVPRVCQPDRYEPNNVKEMAFGVAQGLYENLMLCPQDLDWYSINLGRGDQLGVVLDADPFSENNFSTLVKDATGRTVASGKFAAAYVAAVPATYYVTISTTDQIQPYDMTVLLARGTPCDDDGLEPNDTAMQATKVNNASLLQAVICPQDADWFAIQVPQGKGLKMSLEQYDASRGLLLLCTFGLLGEECVDSIPTQKQYGVEVAGTEVKIRVRAANERVQNSYALKVEYP